MRNKRQLDIQDIQEIEKEIVSTSEHILLLESTISQLNKEADLVAFEAEKKKNHEMKYVLAKSNGLKRAATEKQQEMETSIKKKKELIERKHLYRHMGILMAVYLCYY